MSNFDQRKILSSTKAQSKVNLIWLFPNEKWIINVKQRNSHKKPAKTNQRNALVLPKRKITIYSIKSLYRISKNLKIARSFIENRRHYRIKKINIIPAL